MKQVTILLKYLHFLRHSKTTFDVHSPFLFKLIEEVFNDKTYYDDYSKVEALKKRLLTSGEVIEVTDFGAGSKVMKENRRPVSRITKSSSKPAKYGRLLYRLSRYFKPAHSLELGTSMGLSAAYIALGNPATKLTTIEGCPNISKKALDNFHELELQNINLITGNFDDVLPDFLENSESLDFIFIDGNHRREPTLIYFEQCLKRAVNGTCMVFDDIHWSEEMEAAWNAIRKHSSVTLSVDLFFLGLIFLNTDLSKQDFIIRF